MARHHAAPARSLSPLQPPAERTLSPPQVARRYRVSPDKILAWIRSGELRALNIARRPGGRPRYRIGEADLAAFERSRESPSSPRRVNPRRRARTNDVTEYF